MKGSSLPPLGGLHQRNLWISSPCPRRNESEAIGSARSHRFTNALLHSSPRTHLPSRRGILRIQSYEDNGLVSCLDHDNRSILVADDSKRRRFGSDTFVANGSNSQPDKFGGRDYYDSKFDGHSSSRSTSLLWGLRARKTIRKPGKTVGLSPRRKPRQVRRTNSSNYSRRLPRKTSELPRDNGLCKKSESIKRCWACKERILRLSA